MAGLRRSRPDAHHRPVVPSTPRQIHSPRHDTRPHFHEKHSECSMAQHPRKPRQRSLDSRNRTPTTHSFTNDTSGVRLGRLGRAVRKHRITEPTDTTVSGIESWLRSLQADGQKATCSIQTDVPTERMDSGLAHLTEAKTSILNRWKGQRLNK